MHVPNRHSVFPEICIASVHTPLVSVTSRVSVPLPVTVNADADVGVAAQWPAQSTSGKCARSGRERPSLRVILEAQGQSSTGIAVGGARLLRAWTNGPIRDAAASLGIGKRWPLVQVSQSAERRFCNPQVVGSSPTLGSNMPCVGPDLNDH